MNSGDKAKLAKHVEQIRTLGKRVLQDIIEIGNHLTECQKIVGHGHWERWLGDELQLSDRTALNFMRVAALAKSENFSDLNVPVSGVYLLARPSTPDAAKAEIIEKAKTGAKVTHKDVQETIAKHSEGDANPPASTAPPTSKPEPIKINLNLDNASGQQKLDALNKLWACRKDSKVDAQREFVKAHGEEIASTLIEIAKEHGSFDDLFKVATGIVAALDVERLENVGKVLLARVKALKAAKAPAQTEVSP